MCARARRARAIQRFRRRWWSSAGPWALALGGRYQDGASRSAGIELRVRVVLASGMG
jgi:hypothetical protein